MFKLPEEVKKEIINYGEALEDFRQGKTSALRFKGVRVPWGIYSHRGGGAFMTRVRIPAGIVSAGQLRALAAVAQKYGDGILHITTRQDIQVHSIKIEDSLKIMGELKGEELSSRGGGGNTVRNIITCSRTGICKDEVMDLSGIVAALTEYLLAQENSFKLPRKFKIAFSGCRKDCAACLANDVGFLAREGGFKVWVGGGMGAKAILGKLLEEFIPMEDVVYCVEAVKAVFFKHGDPKNRHQNRLRFLVAKIGMEEFKKLYQQEFQDLKQNKKLVLRHIAIPKLEEITGEAPKQAEADYQAFLKYNVIAQKQPGYSSVELRIPRGDISSDELSRIADLEKEFPGIGFRATQTQNLLLAQVKNSNLYKLFVRLKGILKDFLYSQTLLDLVACKGALTCNLGVCNSPALAAALGEMIKKEFLGSEAFKKLEVRINGCPNSCGQHPLGKVSFYGLVKRVGNRPVPYYAVLIGGRRGEDKTRFAQEIGSIPARSVPAYLKDFFKKAEPFLQNGTDVDAFLVGEGKGIAEETLKAFTAVPAYETKREFYVDWGREEDFSLVGITQGECGAGVLDIIESDIKDAQKYLEGGTFKDLYKALVLAARALLVTKGVDTTTDSEILLQFKQKFVETGIIAYQYKNISEKALSLLKEELTLEEARRYVGELKTEVAAAYKGMDSSFHFPLRSEIKAEAEREQAKEKKVDSHEILMDLRGVACPINYVKAKMKLEMLEKGDKLLLYLDPGEPIQNVPASLKNDGQDVMRVEEKNNYFEVLVKKEA